MFDVELSDEYCKYNKMETLNKQLQRRNILVLEKFYNDQIKMWLGVTTNVQIPIIQVFFFILVNLQNRGIKQILILRLSVPS